ncbi:MAG: hypothetical protein QOH61_2707 [Chloroflexota bacterium]|nr:hypothetical protein [Chloroflexota bacterium]
MTVIQDTGLISGLPVALEIGPKRRVFAQAVGWPGWCRAARDEPRAIEALVAYADRYRVAVGDLAAPLGSDAPIPTVVERVDGDVTTDFGAPGQVVASDRRPLEPGEPQRLAAFLDACWAAFDGAYASVPAERRPVKPDVGRSPDGMRLHILGALRAYASWLAKPVPKLDEAMPDESERAIRGFVRDAVLALPVGVPFEEERHPGPYAVRRECWHVLDHAWELEDRLRA